MIYNRKYHRDYTHYGILAGLEDDRFSFSFALATAVSVPFPFTSFLATGPWIEIINKGTTIIGRSVTSKGLSERFEDIP